jgi:chemotaxis response regulator CheB
MKKQQNPVKGDLQSPPVPEKILPRQKHPLFPIVGIGASAGGLEALELFLRQVPPVAVWPLSLSSISTRPIRGSCPNSCNGSRR